MDMDTMDTLDQELCRAIAAWARCQLLEAAMYDVGPSLRVAVFTDRNVATVSTICVSFCLACLNIRYIHIPAKIWIEKYA